MIARVAPDNTVENTQLFSTEPVDGKPIKTTLDVTTQNAADAGAGRARSSPARWSPSGSATVRCVAVANGPDGGTVDTALTGQVPPGSTFKTVTAYGVAGSANVVTAEHRRGLPEDGGGRRPRVQELATTRRFGKVPFHVDYAKSCNTAFVGLGSKLGADGLHEAATALGLGGQWDLGIDAFSRHGLARRTARPSWPRRPSARAPPRSARWRWPA